MVAGLRDFAAAYMRRRLRAAADGVVRALGERILAAMRTAGARDGAGCGALASGDPAVLDAALRSGGRSAAGLAPLLARTPGAPPPAQASAAAATTAGAPSTVGSPGCDADVERVGRDDP